MNRLSVFLFFFLIAPSLLNAEVQIVDSRWKVSCNMLSNPALALKLEDMEISENYEKMLAMLRRIQKEVLAENLVMDDGEPLNLVLSALELHYLSGMNADKAEISDKAGALIEEYSSLAAGKNFKVYKQLYLMKGSYFKLIKDYSALIENQKRLILYDPLDYASVFSLQDYVRDYPDYAKNMEVFMREFRASGGIVTANLELAAIFSLGRDESQKLTSGGKWLLRWRLDSPGVLLQALPRLTALANKASHEARTEYYYALIDVALQQPNRKDRLMVVAAALDERTKLLELDSGRLPKKVRAGN